MEGPIHTMTLDALAERVGSEIGMSAWKTIDQPTIDAFARITGDQHFIYVDPARAAKVLPSGGTIAHGFFTLSLLSNMAYQVCPTIEGVRFPLNYGFNRLRFVAPVPVGSRVRGRFVLKSVDVIDAAQRQIVYEASVEIDGAPKPALVAEWLTRVLV
ncbi:MAG TPA: MaoC family dehydratase [Burkholderiaceae bacterium]|nr:MaoC family dehydratase [Burkholderiaceae bacterium]